MEKSIGRLDLSVKIIVIEHNNINHDQLLFQNVEQSFVKIILEKILRLNTMLE